MVRVLFLILLGSFWIISGAEAHYIINLEMSTEPRIVRPKIPRESLFLDETFNVRIVSETPVAAKVQILLCYVGEEQHSYYFASFLVELKTEKNNYILDYNNLFVHKGMKGIWYCTLLFDRDPILFELDVYVTSPNEVSRTAEIATETGFYSNVVAPTNIYHYKRNSAKIKRGINGNEERPHNTHSNYKTETEPYIYDYDAEPQFNDTTSNTNKYNYGYGAEPQKTRYGTNSKINNPEPSPYGYDAEPQVNETITNTNKLNYVAAGPRITHFNGKTSKPKNDWPQLYVDARNNLEQPENVKKDNDDSAVDIKLIVFIAIAAGSGVLIGTILGVLCRKKCKTPDNEPIVSFTTADPVYDDVYSAKFDVTNRPPHPLPFEEREENKQYIHYDTPYDHRRGWKPPTQAVTFMK